jgi:hypothetical protein
MGKAKKAESAAQEALQGALQNITMYYKAGMRPYAEALLKKLFLENGFETLQSLPPALLAMLPEELAQPMTHPAKKRGRMPISNTAAM